MIKGVIHSIVRQYYLQNTYREDFWKISMLFSNRLKAQGWSRATIEPIFIAAHLKMTSQSNNNQPDTKPKDPSLKNLIILHLEYHPDNIPRKKVWELYEKNCSEIFNKSLGIKKAIVAHSIARNLRDLVQNAILHEHEGKEVSKFFGG